MIVKPQDRIQSKESEIIHLASLFTQQDLSRKLIVGTIG